MELKIEPTVYNLLVGLMITLGVTLGTLVVLSQTIWWHRTYARYERELSVHSSSPESADVTQPSSNCTCMMSVPNATLFVQLPPLPVLMVVVSPLGYMHFSAGPIAINVSVPFDISTGTFETILPNGTRFAGKVSLADESLVLTSVDYTSNLRLSMFTDPASIVHMLSDPPTAVYDCIRTIDRRADTSYVAPSSSGFRGGNLITASSWSHGEVIAQDSLGVFIKNGIGVGINARKRQIALSLNSTGIFVRKVSTLKVQDSRVLIVGTLQNDWSFALGPYIQRSGTSARIPPPPMTGWVDFLVGAVHLEQEDGERISLPFVAIDNVLDTFDVWNM